MHTVEQEVDMMENPARWPLWPWLPVKERAYDGRKRRKFGVMHADNGPKVFLIGLYEVNKIAENTPTEEYDTFDAVVKAGWMVD